MANISPPLVFADNIVDSLHRRLPAGARRAEVRWFLRAVIIGMMLAILQVCSDTLSPKLGRLAHLAMSNLPPDPRVMSWFVVAAFFLAAIGLAQYKEYDSSSYGLIETVCGVVTIFSFLPDMFRHVQVTVGGVVGVIGGLYLISEGFSLILESAKNRMTSNVARAG